MGFFRWRAGVQLPAAVALLAATLLITPGSAHAATSIDLGAAESYAVLAATTVTNTGASTIVGDVGVSPGTAITGFPPGTVTGGSLHALDPSATQAAADLATAYSIAAGQSSDGTVSGIGGLTLTPGVYSSATSLTLNGTVTLDAQGDPDAVFLLQSGTTLTTAMNSAVSLINGAQACNVFWQVGSSATLGAGTAFAGTVMAFTSVTLTTGASIDGRALAINGAVTLDTNAVARPVCKTVPDPPTALSVVPGDQSVDLSFLPPVDDGGSVITSYEVSTDNGTTWDTLTTTPGSGGTLTGTVTGLTNGTLYNVAVRARNLIGPSDGTASVPATPVTVPGVPTSLSSVPANGGAVLTFSPPASDGGSAITRYEASTDNGTTWVTLTTTPGAGSSLSAPVTGLTNGTLYAIRVRAVNIVGPGPVANTAVTPQAVPGAPTALSAEPADSAAVVTFTPPVDNGGSAITAYDSSIDGGATWQPLAVTGAGATRTGTVTGLTNGTQYDITVRARNIVGPGPAADSASVDLPGAPGAPTDLTAEAGNDSIAVTFTPPADDGGSAITRYDVTMDNGVTWAELTTTPGTGGSRTGVVTGLVDGTSYTLRVRAANVIGAGPGSAPVTETAGIPPSPPTGVTATAGASSITVTWDAPVGEDVTRYTAIAGPGPATCTTTGALTCVLGGVAGIRYTVRVIATVDGVDSEPSLPSNSVVPGPPLVADASPDTDLLLSTDQGDISTARRGQRIVVTGGGYLPFSTVDITLYANPAIRTRVTARADGTFSAPVRIPRSLATGDYVIVASGTNRSGLTRIMKLPFRVPSAGTRRVPAGDSSMPVTGPSVNGMVLLGLGLSVAGLLLYLAAGLPDRRRYTYIPTHRFAGHSGR